MEVSLTEEVSGGVTYRGGEWEVSLTEEVSGGVTVPPQLTCDYGM